MGSEGCQESSPVPPPWADPARGWGRENRAGGRARGWGSACGRTRFWKTTSFEERSDEANSSSEKKQPRLNNPGLFIELIVLHSESQSIYYFDMRFANINFQSFNPKYLFSNSLYHIVFLLKENTITNRTINNTVIIIKFAMS